MRGHTISSLNDFFSMLIGADTSENAESLRDVVVALFLTGW
jgi:hypothetical protein